MSIVILILKIIGFLFLALFLLLALLLFHPLFYQLEGEWKEDAELRGYFWWLFQILRVEFAWEGGKLTIRFRLFGIAKEFGGGRELGGAGEEDTKASDAPKEKEPPRDLSQNAGQDAEMGQAAGSAPGSMKGQEMAGQEGALPDLEAFDEAAGPEDGLGTKERGRGRKKKRRAQKRKEGGGIFKRAAGIRQEWNDPGNRQAVAFLWKEALRLLRRVKPKRIRAEASFSAGDPARTGNVTGALSLLPMMYRGSVFVYPDFLSDKWYVRGSFEVKGHMALFHFVRSFFRVFRNQNIKRIYHKFRK